MYYVCSANKSDRSICSKHSIREDILNEAVLTTVQRQIEVALDLDRALQRMDSMSWERAELRKLEASIDYQNQVIEKNNALRLGIYEDLQSGVLTKAEFLTMKEEFSSRIEQAKGIITKLTKDKSNIQHGLSKRQSWLSQFRE